MCSHCGIPVYSANEAEVHGVSGLQRGHSGWNPTKLLEIEINIDFLSIRLSVY